MNVILKKQNKTLTLYLPIAGKKLVYRQAAVSAVCCVTFKHNIFIGS